MVVRNQIFQKWVGGTFVERFLIGFLSFIEFLQLDAHKDKETLRLLKKVRRQRRSLLSANEMWILYSLARSCAGLPGDMAEVGVYQGASARLLCQCKAGKQLHLFDTFEGLPPRSDQQDGKVHRTRQYACGLESVRAFLAEHDNVHYHKGIFPDSAAEVEDRRYCFVHLDVDLYESTLACLEYFYPKMTPGGIIVSHDYSILAGVEQAVNQFMADKPERIFEMPTSQCGLVKL